MESRSFWWISNRTSVQKEKLEVVLLLLLYTSTLIQTLKYFFSEIFLSRFFFLLLLHVFLLVLKLPYYFLIAIGKKGMLYILWFIVPIVTNGKCFLFTLIAWKTHSLSSNWKGREQREPRASVREKRSRTCKDSMKSREGPHSLLH